MTTDLGANQGMSVAELESMIRDGGIGVVHEIDQRSASSGVEIKEVGLDGQPTGDILVAQPAERQRGPGYVTVYDTRTGEPSIVDMNRLQGQLRKHHSNPDFPEWIGRPAFGFEQTVIPWRGSFKCLLHKEGPDRTHYTEMGLSSCSKSTIPNQYEVIAHMQLKHRREWQLIEQERENIRREEDREWQRSLMEALVKAVPGVTVPTVPTSKSNEPVLEVVGDPSPQTVAQTGLAEGEIEAPDGSVTDANGNILVASDGMPVEQPKVEVPFEEACPECGEVYEAKTIIGATMKVKAHQKRDHRKTTT